jgi:hypothetical protein
MKHDCVGWLWIQPREMRLRSSWRAKIGSSSRVLGGGKVRMGKISDRETQGSRDEGVEGKGLTRKCLLYPFARG